MEFKLTAAQRDVQKAARDFAKAEFDNDIIMAHESDHSFPWEIWRKVCEKGFGGVGYPKEYGGQGQGFLEAILVKEEFCREGAGIGFSVLTPIYGELILRYGSEEQKRKYLPPLFSGEAIASSSFTEPDHGSDITLLSTRAVKKGKEYLINGTKIFITNASIANFIVVLCQTNPEAKPAYRGQSLIIVETEREGVEAVDLDITACRTVASAQLFFADAMVPEENLVGQENQGFYHTLGFLNEARTAVGAFGLGTAQGAFDRALHHTKQRKPFGHKTRDSQVTRHKLADMTVRIEAARLLVYRAAWNCDEGKSDPKLTSIAKWYASRLAVEIADEAIKIVGARALLIGNDLERFCRDARVIELLEGTPEVQKNTIATFLLGKLG